MKNYEKKVWRIKLFWQQQYSMCTSEQEIAAGQSKQTNCQNHINFVIRYCNTNDCYTNDKIKEKWLMLPLMAAKLKSHLQKLKLSYKYMCMYIKFCQSLITQMVRTVHQWHRLKSCLKNQLLIAFWERYTQLSTATSAPLNGWAALTRIIWPRWHTGSIH